MMKKLDYRFIIILLFPITILLNYLASLNPRIVETYYSTTLNKTTIEILSKITNFIPFSLYEVTIIFATLAFIFYFIFTLVKILKNFKKFLSLLWNFILNCSVVLSIAYFLFIALWGLNYNRVPIDTTLGIERRLYSVDDLAGLYTYLIDNVNELREKMPVDSNGISTTNGDYRNVLNRAVLGYDSVSDRYKSLGGTYGTPKHFIFSEFFNYTGITGIYFPYTGQPGVAVKGPSFTIPFTTLHEMAHQRGYASEEEANFIAFITAINHPDVYFKYSGYILALSYTSNALYKEDVDLLKKLNSGLSQNVKKDILYKYDFWNKYDGKIDDISSKINDTYLKSNGVYDGEKSYGRVVDLLISYYQKEFQ